MASNILVWEPNVGFIRINEGTSANPLQENEKEGMWIMLDFISYDGVDFVKTDCAHVMLSELYQEKFESETEVVQYLIDTGWIPETEYYYLYAE